MTPAHEIALDLNLFERLPPDGLGIQLRDGTFLSATSLGCVQGQDQVESCVIRICTAREISSPFLSPATRESWVGVIDRSLDLLWIRRAVFHSPHSSWSEAPFVAAEYAHVDPAIRAEIHPSDPDEVTSHYLMRRYAAA